MSLLEALFGGIILVAGIVLIVFTFATDAQQPSLGLLNGNSTAMLQNKKQPKNILEKLIAGALAIFMLGSIVLAAILAHGI